MKTLTLLLYQVQCQITWTTTWLLAPASLNSLSLQFSAARKLSVSYEGVPYNHLFTLAKFREALATCKNLALGPEVISFQMIRNHHLSTSAFILTLFNRILVEGIFPPVQQQALIVPIPKPGKDPGLTNNHRLIALT